MGELPQGVGLTWVLSSREPFFCGAGVHLCLKEEGLDPRPQDDHRRVEVAPTAPSLMQVISGPSLPPGPCQRVERMAPESPTWTRRVGSVCLFASLSSCVPLASLLVCSICAWCVCTFVSVPGHVTSLGGGLDLAYLSVCVCVCVCVCTRIHAWIAPMSVCLCAQVGVGWWCGERVFFLVRDFKINTTQPTLLASFPCPGA